MSKGRRRVVREGVKRYTFSRRSGGRWRVIRNGVAIRDETKETVLALAETLARSASASLVVVEVDE